MVTTVLRIMESRMMVMMILIIVAALVANAPRPCTALYSHQGMRGAAGGAPRWASAPVYEGRHAAGEGRSSSERWFDEQLVDHFGPVSEKQYWSQRYFVNETHLNPAGGDGGNNPVVLLCVGGEGPPLDPDVVVDGDVHCAIAVSVLAPMLSEKMGIPTLVVALEHRYYGESHPVPDLSTPNMRFLSSRQALNDIAKFIGFITDKYSFKEPRVVTFGGSYPGMLAGWARLKFPHLVKASVASSAPINAVLNYRGYYEVVGKALGNQSVGGSAACVDAVESAFEELGKKLDTESGRMDIAKAFDICGNADGGGDSLAIAANKGLLVATLSNLFPAQSNDPACDAANCNIEKVCASMTESIASQRRRGLAFSGARLPERDLSGSRATDPLSRLALISQSAFGPECLSIDWKEERAALLDTSLKNWDRVWVWQTCNEFAFFQTCDEGSSCPFTKGAVNLSSYLDDCKAAFNVTDSEVGQAVTDTNNFYGGSAISGSRIMYPNGDVDPWYSAGLLTVRRMKPHTQKTESEESVCVYGARADSGTA